MYKDLAQNIDYLKNLTDKSADFTVRNMVLSDGTAVSIITIEGMVNKDGLALSVTNPLVSIVIPDGVNKYEFIRDRVLTSSEIVEIDTFNQLIEFSMSGFAVVAVDGYSKMLVVGIQGFSFRSVSEPSS